MKSNKNKSFQCSWAEAILVSLVYLSLFSIFWTGITTTSIVLCGVFYALGIWSVGAGYHRYFSHKSYSTSRPFQFILAFLAQSTAQCSVLWWADKHRQHHLYSDTDKDLHSPRQHGFFHAHTGWIFVPANFAKGYKMVKDLEAFPELIWLDKFYLLPPILLGIVSWLIGGWSGLIAGFLLSRVLVWNATFTINSLAHQYGSQRYNTGDDSRNNFWLALLTFGEGWHNNHHHYASSARQGFFWWEIDLTYYSLKFLSLFGIIWDLKQPAPEVIQGIKEPTPNVTAKSRQLIQNSTNLGAIATKLSSFVLEAKSAMSNLSQSSVYLDKVEPMAKQCLNLLRLQNESLRQLPPKLSNSVKKNIQQINLNLQALIDAINSATRENITNYINALENASSQLSKLVTH